MFPVRGGHVLGGPKCSHPLSYCDCCFGYFASPKHTGLLHNVAPANPSKHFQRLIGAKLLEDEPFATAFLNSVLSQLNWAFSEFILLLQEVSDYGLSNTNYINYI